jgi:HlyD family secretion protein
MEISATISEADIGTVETGQSVSFTVDAFPSRKFQGTVRQVRNNSTIANNVVTYPVIVTVANDDLKLRPGMTANIVIATTKRTNALRVPNAALRFKAPEGATVIAAAASPTGAASFFDRMPAEVQQRLLAQFDKNGDGKLDADERKAMEAAMRSRMAAASSGGGFGPPGGGPPPGGGFSGPGGGAGGARAGFSSSSQPVTLYLVDSKPNAAGHATGSLQAVQVVVGVSDSTNAEILSGVNEGDVVAVGIVSAQAAAAAATTGTNNIFGPPRPPGAGTRR